MATQTEIVAALKTTSTLLHGVVTILDTVKEEIDALQQAIADLKKTVPDGASQELVDALADVQTQANAVKAAADADAAEAQQIP